jgi:hypothetical protein
MVPLEFNWLGAAEVKRHPQVERSLKQKWPAELAEKLWQPAKRT